MSNWSPCLGCEHRRPATVDGKQTAWCAKKVNLQPHGYLINKECPAKEKEAAR